VLANTRSTACKQIGRNIRPDAAGMLRPSDSMHALQLLVKAYGCSIDPPARWATIFLAF